MKTAEREQPAIRGAICRSFLDWVRGECGPTHPEERFVSASAELTAAVVPGDPHFGMLVNRMYPAETVHELLELLMPGADDQQRLQACDPAGQYIFKHQLSGLQRAVFSLMLTPKRYVKHAHRAFRHNFSDGDLNYEEGEDWHRCVYTNWSCHHPLVCRMVMFGKLSVYRAMGCANPTIEIERCDPATGCSSLVRWGDAVA